MERKTKIAIAVISTLALGGGLYVFLKARKRKKNTFKICNLYCYWDKQAKGRDCDQKIVQITLAPSCTPQIQYDIPPDSIKAGDIIKIVGANPMLDGKHVVNSVIPSDGGKKKGGINAITIATDYDVYAERDEGENSVTKYNNKAKVILLKHQK